jgi:hypothetical protein
MRSLRLAILPLLVAASLAAQAPAPSNAPATPAAAVAPDRTAFFDVAALIGSRERFGLEPLVFGRWTVGLVAAHSHSGASAPVLTAPIGIPDAVMPCPSFGCGPQYPAGWSSYNAWSLDFAARYYPAALTSSDARRRFMVYVGEFVGYQWRTINRISYAYPLFAPCPAPGCTDPVNETQRLSGWEPGAEIGMRLRPLEPLFIDVGGWFKLVRLNDPTQRLRPGDLDSRLVVAVGVGW